MAGEKEGVWIRPGFIIPAAELHFAFSRSSGPGGQNVNKTNTKVRLKWWPSESGSARAALSDTAMKRLLARAKTSLAEDGSLQFASDRFRIRDANRKACCRRLAERIRSWLRTPKRRIPTGPTRKSKVQRLDSKKRISKLKALRRKPDQE